jgi:hypothetical protein
MDQLPQVSMQHYATTAVITVVAYVVITTDVSSAGVVVRTTYQRGRFDAHAYSSAQQCYCCISYQFCH